MLVKSQDNLVLIVTEPFPEPVFFNVYGAQESILRHQFRQPM
jgi:hypothetical protein